MQATKKEFQKNEIVNGENRSYYFLELVGLSTDVKPTLSYEGMYLQEGSTFFCMDTKKAYMLNASNAWVEL